MFRRVIVTAALGVLAALGPGALVASAAQEPTPVSPSACEQGGGHPQLIFPGPPRLGVCVGGSYDGHPVAG